MHIKQQDNCLYISGEISVRTLTPAIYQQFIQQIKLPEIKIIDFQHSTKVDSVGLALLITVKRYVANKITVLSIPNSIQDLAKLYEIQDWIKSS